MKEVQIELSEEATRELYELKKKLNPKDKTHPYYEDIGSYEDFKKKMKRKKIGALFG